MGNTCTSKDGKNGKKKNLKIIIMSKKDRNKGLYSTLCYLHETLAQVKVTWNNGMMEFKTGVTSEKAMTQKGPRELARGRRPSWS